MTSITKCAGALATVGTIFIIANSYSQIIELFPSGSRIESGWRCCW